MSNRSGNSPLPYSVAKLPVAVAIVLEDARLAEALCADGMLLETVESAARISDHIFLAAAEGISLPHLEGVVAVNTTIEDDEAGLLNAVIEKIESETKLDWLLRLNPGERFDTATFDDLARFLAEGADRNSIYMMVLHRIIRPDGRRHDLDEETIDARLMPLRKGIRFEGRLQASPLPMAEKLMIELSASPGRLLCPPRRRYPKIEKLRGERTLRILNELDAQGEAMGEERLALRGEAHSAIGEFGAARSCFLKLISETKRTDLRLSAYYDLWETFTFSPINPDEMTKILLAGLDHFPVDQQLLTFMGAHLQRTGKLDIAARTFETAVRYGQISLDVWHRLHIREIAVTSLAIVQRLRGRVREAIKILETHRENFTDRSEYDRNLLDLYISEKMEGKAKEFAATIWGDQQLDQMRDVIAGACLAASGQWTEAVLPLQKAFAAGCRDLLCLRWYALALLALIRFTEAQQILRLWSDADPDNTEAQSYLLAAKHPESFGKIVKSIQDARLQSLGIAGAELFKKGAAPSKTKKVPAIEDAVRDMVSSSGSPGSKIRCFRPTKVSDNS